MALMIESAIRDDQYFAICDQLENIRGVSITKPALYGLMKGGLYSGAKSFLSHDQGLMTGCMVLYPSMNINRRLVLQVVVLWLHRKYPHLWEEYMELAEQVAEEIKATAIVMDTKRNSRAIERKFGKYGYKQLYTTIGKVLA